MFDPHMSLRFDLASLATAGSTAGAASGATNTLGQLATTAMVASSLNSAVGGFFQNQRAADIAKDNAEAQRAAARAETVRLRRDQARRAGLLRATVGATGTTFEGSPLEILGDQAMEFEENARLALYSGEVGARNSLMEADAYQRQGIAGLTGGLTGALGTGLLGYSQYGFPGGGSMGGSASPLQYDAAGPNAMRSGFWGVPGGTVRVT